MLQTTSTDGGVYAVPLYITPVVAYYRESWVKEAGIEKLPETWEEYYELCKAVTDPSKNRYGFGIPLGEGNHAVKTIWSFLQGNGVNLVNVDAKGNWYVDIDAEDKAAMVETYNSLQNLLMMLSTSRFLLERPILSTWVGLDSLFQKKETQNLQKHSLNIATQAITYLISI